MASSDQPTEQELKLENLMRERIEKHNADTRQIHEERNARTKIKTQQLVDLMREYFLKEYSELMEQVEEEEKLTNPNEIPVHETKPENNKQEPESREKAGKNSTDDTHARGSLIARFFKAICNFFQRIFGGGDERRTETRRWLT